MKIGTRLPEPLLQMLMDECVHCFREIRPRLSIGYARFEMPNERFITIKDGIVIGIE
jgi:hypothetical protein